MCNQVTLCELLIRKPVDDDESCKAGPGVVELRRLVACGQKWKAANRIYSSEYIR